MNFNNTPIIIKGSDQKKILVVIGDEHIDTHYGRIDSSKITKLPMAIKTSNESTVLLYKPSYREFVLNMKRGPQIIYPKDVASILVDGNIWNDSVVLEIGSGTGALTLALVLSVGENGYVYSVDNNSKNQRRASKTISRFLNSKDLNVNNFEFIHNEAEDLPVSEINKIITHVVTDIPEPWHIVTKLDIGTELKWISFLPNITQVQILNETLVSSGYTNIYIKEIIEREWKVKDKIVRPVHNITGHTGFLVFADHLV